MNTPTTTIMTDAALAVGLMVVVGGILTALALLSSDRQRQRGLRRRGDTPRESR